VEQVDREHIEDAGCKKHDDVNRWCRDGAISLMTCE
jgi:hypothetical protein